MSRPATKGDLLIAASEQYENLWTLIDGMTPEERATAFAFDDSLKAKEAHWSRDKNLRDVLVHLYEWHQLLLRWIQANQKGISQPFLPEPYNWKTYGDMNVMLWEKHQSTPYEESKKMLMDSHQQVMKTIDSFSNEELFQKKHFPWTGTTNLGSYCISATSSHYDWALKKLKQHLKGIRAKQSS